MQVLMPNIRSLRDSLREDGWCITAFRFTYNKAKYIVLIEDIEKLDIKVMQYAIVRITFIDIQNHDRVLQAQANSAKIMMNPREFREYFGIEYSENLGDIFAQFYSYFNRSMPCLRQDETDPELKDQMVNQLSMNDNDNPNARNCYEIKINGIRNGRQFKRTPFNADKGKLLRPDVFKYIQNESRLSLCFSERRDDLPVEVLLANLARNLKKRQITINLQ